MIMTGFCESGCPAEEAEALKRLMDEHAYQQDQLARIIGKSPATISVSPSLNKLPKEIRDECRQDPGVPKSVLIEIPEETGTEHGDPIQEIPGSAGKGRRPADRCLNESEAHQGGGPCRPDRRDTEQDWRFGFSFLLHGGSGDGHGDLDLSEKHLDEALARAAQGGKILA
jgi:hypothetical protein